MKLLNNEIYRQDLDLIIKQNSFLEFKNKSVLITGATGLICSSIVDLLLFLNEKESMNMTIYAACRNYNKFLDRFPSDNHLKYVQYDANEQNVFDFKCDYIIHGAGNASPELYISDPVGTMISNFEGVNELLKYAKKNKSKLLYISSSEVYGRKTHDGPFVEDDYGYVDILNVRSSYPSGKRASETLCKAYASQYGVKCVICRPGHIYGPSASSADNKISSLFPRMAVKGENLVMKSEGKQLRSYCYSLDCASAILMVLYKGISGEAYNISNKDSIITIRKMAEIIAEKANVELLFQLPTAQELNVFNPMDNSSLNSLKLEELGWKGCFNAELGLEHTINILKAE